MTEIGRVQLAQRGDQRSHEGRAHKVKLGHRQKSDLGRLGIHARQSPLQLETHFYDIIVDVLHMLDNTLHITLRVYQLIICIVVEI